MTPVDAFLRAQDTLLRSHGIDASARVVDLGRLGIRGRFLEVGEGPPVVLIHGGGGTGAEWAPLLPRLDGFREIVPDRPGFGLTDAVDYGGVDLRAHAVDFVRDVLDAAGIDRASFVGNSMGALWIFWFALQEPDRVHRIAALGTPALILGSSAPLGMRLLGVPALGRAMTAIEPPSPSQVRTLLERLGHDPGRVASPELVDLVVALESLPWYRDAWLSLLGNVFPLGRVNPDLALGEAALGRLPPNVLYVWGEDDPFGALDVGRRAAAATPGARLEVVGKGHLPWLDDPDGCGSAVAGFLRERVG